MAAEMTTEEMYKIIKKQNGEKFARILRENVLLDIPNLKHILEFAGTNIEDAENLVPILREIQKKSKEIAEEIKLYQTPRDPLDLLDEAGYDAFYANNLTQQNSIEKYFEPHEKLCTFNDPERYKNYYIIHAVKKNVKNIKRGRQPKREDEYGTSVISIQIAKSGGFISIKNRYNHTVDNPDATFNNNPDNIIRGLTMALKNKFGVDFMTQNAEMPNNYRLVNNQLVRFNYEIDNIYYDAKYYFTGSTITKLNPDYEVMLDSVILDERTGKIRSVHQSTEYLSQILNSEISGNKVKTEKNKTTGETIINIIDENKNIKELARTKNGCITSLHLYKTSELDKNFLKRNKTLKALFAPKLKKIENGCFSFCQGIRQIYIPELEEMGLDCFSRAYELTELNAPMLKTMKGGCFARCRKIKKLYIPQLEKMGMVCFQQNDELTELVAPKLKKMGNGCFSYNAKLKNLYIPELEEIYTSVFANVKHLHEIIAPKLKKMGSGCFQYVAMLIEKLYVPELEEMRPGSFNDAKIIKNLYAPKLKITEDTPKCILRAIKLAKFKDGIKNALHLSHRGFNENNFVESQQTRDDF